MRHEIDLASFHGEDFKARMDAAMAYARENPETVINIPAGVHLLTGPLARKTQADVMSSVYGENPERAMFQPDFAFMEGVSFEGHRGTTINARGAAIMADGFMEVLAIKNCRDIRVQGLTIDTLRKPFSMGRILCFSKDKQWMDVRFDGAFPIDEKTPMPRYCAYDARTRLFNLSMRAAKRTLLERQTMRFFLSAPPDCDLTGQAFYVWHTFHYRPSILIENAANVTLEDVTIHSHPGMGVVGHRSENILLSRLKVVPSPGLHMSTNTDATHFTSCKGDLIFEGCRFEGHGDDATNVHTFYHDIKPLSKTSYRGSVAVTTHSLTPDYPDAGDIMELTDKASLTLARTYRVVSCEKEKDGYTAVLDKPLPEDAENWYLSDVSRLPRLRFRNCHTHNHWARSVLVKTRNAVIENNVFSGSSLWGVHIAAEAGWHEGVSCQNIVIRNNTFINCGKTGGADVGGVCVEMSVPTPKGTPQENIAITDNVFDMPAVPHAVSVRNAKKVLIQNNRFRCLKEPVIVRDSQDVQLDAPVLDV